jgi:hypothetical protein
MRRGLQVLGRKASRSSGGALGGKVNATPPIAAFSSDSSITVDLSKAFDTHSTYIPSQTLRPNVFIMEILHSD